MFEYRQVFPQFQTDGDCKKFELNDGFELAAVSDGGERMPRGVVLWGRRRIHKAGVAVPAKVPKLEYKSVFVPYLGFGNGQNRVPVIMNEEQGQGWEAISTTDQGLYPPIGVTIWFKREKFPA